jgi:hypothetical protein
MRQAQIVEDTYKKPDFQKSSQSGGCVVLNNVCFDQKDLARIREDLEGQLSYGPKNNEVEKALRKCVDFQAEIGRRAAPSPA